MIYILEDDDNIRKFVSYALTKEGYEVQGFSRPSEFRKALEENLPDLLLLDIMLPEEDGLSILCSLRASARWKKLPVIMVTAKTSEFDKVTGLDSGADDYIAKPFGITELVSRVRAVLRRCGDETEVTEYKVGELSVDISKHTVKTGDGEVSLSYKEYMLLLALLEANGNVQSRADLFKKVWGEYYGESRTLDVHMGKLRRKLGNAGAMIHTVKNVGYKLGGEQNE